MGGGDTARSPREDRADDLLRLLRRVTRFSRSSRSVNFDKVCLTVYYALFPSLGRMNETMPTFLFVLDEANTLESYACGCWFAFGVFLAQMKDYKTR